MPLYLLELLWLFLGVAIVADIFMAAIEQITSQEKKVTLMVRGEWTSYYVRVWNPTVANLSLMALGSSAPEIMLSVIELFSNGMHTGELGPSTIVGSAAFNMLIILAICILAIPDGETRSIKELGVYACTAVSSVLAYVWLIVILQWSSPDLIEPWEGIATFIAFFVLLTVAFLLDIGWFSKAAAKRRAHRTESLATGHMVSASMATDEAKLAASSPPSSATSRRMPANASAERISQMVSTKLQRLQPRSRAFYRVQATRNMTGGRRVSTIYEGVDHAPFPRSSRAHHGDEHHDAHHAHHYHGHIDAAGGTAKRRSGSVTDDERAPNLEVRQSRVPGSLSSTRSSSRRASSRGRCPTERTGARRSPTPPTSRARRRPARRRARPPRRRRS